MKDSSKLTTTTKTTIEEKMGMKKLYTWDKKQFEGGSKKCRVPRQAALKYASISFWLFELKVFKLQPADTRVKLWHFSLKSVNKSSTWKLPSLCWEVERQPYRHWSGLPCPPPRIFLIQGLNLHLLHWQVVLYHWASLVPQMVKRLPAMWETWVQALAQEDPLGKEMATHSSTLAWKFPWTEEPSRLLSPWGCRKSDTAERRHFLYH